MAVTESSNAPTLPVDLLDPRVFDDPWDLYRWLRAEDPVHWDEVNELWVVSRHEEVSLVSRTPERYSSAQGVRPNLAAPLSIIAMDDPEHTRQRRLVSTGFTPRRVRDLADRIRELSREITAEIATKETINFVPEFAMHVPIVVIAEMLGLDTSMRNRLYKWSDDMMSGDGHSDPEDPAFIAAGEAFDQYVTLCQQLIDERRRIPKDDIISILTGAYDDGQLLALDTEGAEDTHNITELEDLELLMFFVLLVVAGNETTRNALSGGLLALSRFPEERQRLIDDPSLWELAADEVVRYVSPVLSFSRTVTETHELHGRTIEAGQKVLMLYQSANRDADVFTDPDRFIADRDPNPHLGFGIGSHYCMGASLAKAEIRIVFEELFARLPNIHVPEGLGPRRGNSSLVLSIDELPAVVGEPI